MKALVSHGALDATTYFEKLNRLRAANLRFIPIEKDEILHQLTQAKIDHGFVIETEALIGLRRYVAACLLQSDILQHPPVPDGLPNKDGEIAFVLGIWRSISDALVEIWKSGVNNDNARWAHADWILASLFLDHLGLLGITSFRKEELEDISLAALSLALLLFQGTSFD